MRCPSCGKWNRATFPKCIHCGTPLPLSERKKAVSPVEQANEDSRLLRDNKPRKTVVDHLGNIEEISNPKDRHAKEMANLIDRIKHGEEIQKELQETVFKSYKAEEKAAQSYYVSPALHPSFTADAVPKSHLSANPEHIEHLLRPKKIRKTRYIAAAHPRLRHLFLLFALLSLSAGLVFLGLEYFRPKNAPKSEDELLHPDVFIQASFLDEFPAHNIRIKVDPGKMLYIKELRKVVGPSDGHISFDIPDYIWYEDHKEVLGDKNSYLPPSMDVSFTPYLRAENGNLSPLPPISYSIDIPLSDALLLNPNTTHIKSSLQNYMIRFQVDPNSIVYIRQVEDYIPLNIQNGLVSYNAPVQQGLENKYHFLVKTEHQRIRDVEITIFREKQAFTLDLAANIDDESSLERMLISGSTLAGAEITVLTPHEKLDLSEMPTLGNFRFNALFNKYGNNTIQIQAKYGDKTVLVEHQVYYSPDANTYTSKAWALNDGFGYANLLANLNSKIEKAQVYVVYATVLDIISEKPQLAVVDASDGKTSGPLYVLLENQSKAKWEIGGRYRIYAEASGMYDSYPRLMARFTYKRK